MNQLILLVAAAFMVGAGIYLGQQGLALARANKALRKVIADMDRVAALESALREIGQFCGRSPPADSGAWSVLMMVPEDLRGSQTDGEGNAQTRG